MRSLFLLHNETINIWSHLLGFAFFAALFVHDLVLVIPAVTDDGKAIITKTDFLVLLILLICYQVNIFFYCKNLNSTITFNTKCNQVDYLHVYIFHIAGNDGAFFIISHVWMSCFQQSSRNMFFSGYSWYYRWTNGYIFVWIVLCFLLRTQLARFLSPHSWWHICSCYIYSVHTC